MSFDAGLTRAVSAVPGVIDVYPAMHTLARLVGPAVGSAGSVDVDRTAEGVVVTARIGTSRASSTVETAHAVADALLAASDPDASIKVHIARIA